MYKDIDTKQLYFKLITKEIEVRPCVCTRLPDPAIHTEERAPHESNCTMGIGSPGMEGPAPVLAMLDPPPLLNQDSVPVQFPLRLHPNTGPHNAPIPPTAFTPGDIHVQASHRPMGPPGLVVGVTADTPQSPQPPDEPPTSKNITSNLVEPSTPAVNIGYHTNVRRPSRAEIAKQVLDAYRAEPASPPSPATLPVATETSETHRPGPPLRSSAWGTKSGDYPLPVPTPLTNIELPKQAVEEHEYRRIPSSTPQPPIQGSLPLPKQTSPIRTTQAIRAPSSPILPSLRITRLGIIEEAPTPGFPASPTPPKVVPTALPERLASRPVRHVRAVSDTLPTYLLRAKLKEQQRKEHLAHGTWQQGRFRPPWDELTVISSGSGCGDDPGPKRYSLDANSPGLFYGELGSPHPGSLELSWLDSSRGSIEVAHRASSGKCNNPRDSHEMQELLAQHRGEGGEPPDMAELQALLPHGFPGTLRLYYQLEVLAEHYFDTLQPDMAIYIYTTYLTPPLGTAGVTYPPRAATWFTLGQIYLSTHSFLSALRSFEHAAQCDPFEVASHVQAGYVNFLLGEYQEAEEAYHRALGGFRDAPKINYQVLGLDAIIRREDICRSIEACEQRGLGTGVWGIASGKIYRVPGEKKRNIERRKYFDQGKVVGRAVEVSKIGFGGKRKVVQVKEDDSDSDGAGLEKVKTHNSSVWNWRSPVPTISGRAQRPPDSVRLEELERAPTLGKTTTRGSVDNARLETPKASAGLMESKKEKSHRTSSSFDYVLGLLGWR